MKYRNVNSRETECNIVAIGEDNQEKSFCMPQVGFFGQARTLLRKKFQKLQWNLNDALYPNDFPKDGTQMFIELDEVVVESGHSSSNVTVPQISSSSLSIGVSASDFGSVIE